MSRTLTVGTPSPRRTIPTASNKAQDSQDQIVAWIWGAVADLWRYGAEWAAWDALAQQQDEKTERLFQQLQDPALQQHPKFQEAQDRCWRWERLLWKQRAYAESVERVVQGVQRNMARHLKRLTPRRRDELLANRGWVRADDPEDVAAGMWERAKRQEVWPGGEAGFLRPDEQALSAERVGMSLGHLWSREGMTWPNSAQCPF